MATMEDRQELDLTYVTERIIAVSFPWTCNEETYHSNLQDVTHMLKSKHGDSYLVINVSEKRLELSKMNPKVMDLGWPDLHAPPLDKMCTICKAMESWFNSSPQHVVVIHCRGGKGRIGVIISSFVHFTDISASADQALERFAMRKFCDDKVSTSMTPSQKRYVWILNSLLTRSIKMNPSPLFLHCVILHGIPSFNSEGVCQPYLKVYQGMKVVYSSGIYNIGPGHRNRIYIVLQPAQLLKGDILVKCYHKDIHAATREVIFYLQFHTGTVQGYSLIFEKEDLEIANRDARFPDYGKVELVLSESPERIQGSDRWKNVHDVTVDHSMTDLLVRWDSYQNLSCDGEVPHMHAPADASSCTKVMQRNLDGSTLRWTNGVLLASSSDCSDHTLSTSSDSGLSSASAQTGHLSGSLCSPSSQETIVSKRLLGKIRPEWAEPLGRMSEHNVGMGKQQATFDREPRRNHQEIALLDNEAPSHDLCSMGSIGTLYPEGPYYSYHKCSQNSLLSDSCGSNEMGGEDELEQRFFQRNGSFSQSMYSQAFSETGYPLHSWVKHQQMVATQQNECFPLENRTWLSPGRHSSPNKPNGTLDTAIQRSSSREVMQRAGSAFHHDSTYMQAADEQDKLTSPTVDIDQSIDQLNQLIMDLDPTFVPVPTCSSSVRRNATPHENGLPSCHTNGMNYRFVGSNRTEVPKVCQSASDIRGDRKHSKSPQDSFTDHAGFHLSGWDLREDLQNFLTYAQNAVTLQPDHLENRHRCEEVDSRMLVLGEVIPPTPAFPIPPPTPYVRDQFDFSQVACSPQPSPGFQPYRMQLKSRAYLENPDHSPLAQDIPMSATLGPSRYPLTSVHFAPTDGLLPWSESLLNHESPFAGLPPKITLQHSGCLDYSSSSLHHSSPSCHSPLKIIKSTPGAKFSPSSNLSQGSEKHEGSRSGKEDVILNGGLELPPLPEKRRVSQGEQPLGSTSPAPSGFSSAHNGSIGVPFPSSLMEPGGRTPSTPAALQDGKQENAKFVQDTSKFWYKPDISRDQAISILKDKEPGSFIVRDSHSFRGAYGLAMKVATPPPSAVQQIKQGRDLSTELVRHFLIECTQKGVRLKGCPNEPYFGSLTALVCHHSVIPLALPCKLIIPDRDPLEETGDPSSQTAANSATELLKQGAACNVWFLGSVEMESLTGSQAVQKATSITLNMDPPPISTVVHFKVSTQGITLTDNQRKLFFRRHYAVSTVIFCSLDPQERKWTRDGCSSAKIFGFVARKSGSATENVCHLFAEHDPEQPASAIVNFISKVMIGSLRGK